MLGAVIVALLLTALVYTLLSRVRVSRGGSRPGQRYPPIARILAEPGLIKYNLKGLRAPETTGFVFKALIWLAYTRLGQLVFVPRLKKGSKLDAIGGVYLPESPTLYPVPSYPPPVSADYGQSNEAVIQKLFDDIVQKSQGEVSSEFRFPTVADYWKAYKSGLCTPADVALAVLTAIENSNTLRPPLRAIVSTKRDVVMAMAEASTQRWKDGVPLSLLDGVPVAVKGELHVEPYDFFSGAVYVTELAGGVPEASSVQKLKDAGAVIIGIANLQEFGTGTLGSNPNWRHLTARNPYNTDHYPGGSSSGSAVSVAVGLCPISIGTDGGGSIRIPAALCGVVGLKPTFGLIDLTGVLPVSHSVGVAGPLSSSVLDAAIALNVISRETDGDRTLSSLDGLGDTNLDGVKVGIYWEYFTHAEEEIVSRVNPVVSQLRELGAEIVNIKIPELENSRIAHLSTIISEMTGNLAIDADKHFDEFNLETLLLMAGGMGVSAIEYINAQKQRTRAVTSLKHIFKQVDIILTPATACIAPIIRPAAIPNGESNLKVTGQLANFTFLCNLCGNPGLVMPVAYSAGGLPISVQLMGRWYEEGLLLRVGMALERSGAFPLKKPQVFYDLLSSAKKGHSV